MQFGNSTRNFRMEYVSNAVILESEVYVFPPLKNTYHNLVLLCYFVCMQYQKWAEENRLAGLKPVSVGEVDDLLKGLEEARLYQPSFAITKQMVEEKRKLGIAPVNFGFFFVFF